MIAAMRVVLLHGFTQTRQSWRRTVAALGGRYRALAPDLPGHGQAAERRPASFAACAAYVRALADEPCVLVGYSMGGRIALYTALAMPDLVAAARARRGQPGDRRRGRARAAPGSRRGARRPDRGHGHRGVRDRVGLAGAVRGPARARRRGRARRPAAQHAVRPRRGAARARHRRDAAAVGPAGGAGRAGHARSPASATRSSARSPGGWRRRSRDCRVEVVDGAGHAAQLEQPEIVAAAIRGTP